MAKKKITIKVEFEAVVTLSDSAIKQAIEFEKQNAFTLDDCEFEDLTIEEQKRVLYEWFISEVGIGSYHRDYSGKAPMICLSDTSDDIEKISIEEPWSELIEQEES